MKPGRPLGWALLLALDAVFCAIWAAQPSLHSAPFLRVGIFAGLGLAGAGLSLRVPNRWSIIGGAVLLRLILLPAPVSDDVHRYLWEGKLVRHGINPYAQTADAPALKALRDEQWEAMNHRERPTAYPPLAELAFATVGALAYHPLALKLVFVLCDLATLLLILSLLRDRGDPIGWSGWYAFNPVVLIGIAGEAHYDVLFVLALAIFWWATERRRAAVAWIALGMSVQLKVVSLLLAPFYAGRKSIRSAWLFPVMLILPALPFVEEMPALVRGIRGFAGSGQFNDVPYYLLDRLLPHLSIFLFLLLYFLVWFCHYRGRLTVHAASFWVLGGLIFFSPIVHYWYLLWIVPLLALRPNPGWLVFCVAQAGYFIAWQTETSEGWWGLPLWAVFTMWTPFLVLLAAGCFRRASDPDAL